MAITRIVVHVFRDGRWTQDTVFDEEAKARSHAQNLLKQDKFDGARVLREKRRVDGGYDEEVLFEQIKKGDKKKDFSLSEITSAPVCESYLDLYKPDSRSTVNRLLSKYLDDVILTPTELLHNHRELKRLLDMDLAQAALDRVSTLQATQSSTDARTRLDQLSGFFDQALQRASKAPGKVALPSVKDIGFAEAVKRIDASAPESDRDFFALTALSLALAEGRAWTAKIEMVLAEMAKSDDQRALTLLDSVLADLCGARNVLAEMIGGVPNLGDLLLKLMDLGTGKLVTATRQSSDPIIAMNLGLAAGKLPETYAEIMSQIQRQLQSAAPLARNEPKAEFEAFRRILEKVVTPDDIIGGPLAAEAMTIRYSRFLSKGGASGRREAIQVVTSYLPTAMQQVRFLIALTATELGREQKEYTIGTLEGLIGNAKRMEDLVGLKGTPKTRMQEIVVLYGFLRKTTSLPARVCAPLAEKLDALVADFLIANKVIEKLDNPADSLRVRAMRLLQFCTSGVLTEGRAFSMARDRVLAILRQPKFDEKFVADIPDLAQRDKALREFHHALAASRFLEDLT